MNPFTFAENKHTPSFSSKKYVLRKTLMAKYDLACKNNYIFVSGALGSGKSTSSLLWINYAKITPIWFNLDEYDNIFQVFYKQLAMALFQHQSSNQNIKKILSASDFNSDPVKHLQLIITELYFEEKSYALVFDNIHYIKNKEILQSLPSVLRRLPNNYTIIYISKSAIQDELKNFFYEEELLIRSQDLAFNIKEIKSYFTLRNKSIDENKALKIYSQTEGLAIGLEFLSQDEALEKNDEVLTKELVEYFEKNLWKSLPLDVRNFCLSLALFDDFDLELALEFSKNPDAKSILNELLSNNDFLVYKNGLYYFSALFKKFLRKKVEISEVDINTLHKKACYYYKEKDEYYKALFYAIRCNDEKEISSFLWLFFLYKKMSVYGELAFLKVLFEKELEPVLYQRSPVFHAIALRYYSAIGEKEKCHHHRKKILELLPEISKENSIAIDYALWSIYLDNTSSISEKLRLHKIIRAQHDSQKVIDEVLNKEEVKQIKRRLHFTSHHIPFAHRAMLDFSEMALKPELIFEIDESYAKPHWVQWFFWRILALAYLALEQLDLAKAKEYYKEALRLSAIAECREARFSYFVLEHLLFSYTKEYEKSSLALNKLEEFLKTVPPLMPNFLAYKVKQALIEGNTSCAFEWINYPLVKEELEDKPNLLQIFRRFTTIRVYIAVGKYAEAEEQIIIMKNFLEGYNRTLDRGEIKALLSLVYWYTDRKEEAVQELAEVIELFYPYNYCKVFVEEGFALLPILKKIVAHKTYESKIEQFIINTISLTKAFSKKNKGYVRLAQTRPLSRKIKLSKQQYTIVSLLAKGFSNSQICEKMNRKITTIKSHTSALYKKLEVNNVESAIKKAKELGLL